MKIYLVYEYKNNNLHPFLKGVYLTEFDAKANCKEIGKSSHTEIINGKLQWIKDQYRWEVTETELEYPTFDIYIDTISGNGNRISNLSLEKANELFDKYSKANWVSLQIPLKQFGSVGVTEIKSNKSETYWKQYHSYWEAREREDEFYSPSCPWNAPGMRISDFI